MYAKLLRIAGEQEGCVDSTSDIQREIEKRLQKHRVSRLKAAMRG